MDREKISPRQNKPRNSTPEVPAGQNSHIFAIVGTSAAVIFVLSTAIYIFVCRNPNGDELSRKTGI
jgi:hypothetical protein